MSIKPLRQLASVAAVLAAVLIVAGTARADLRIKLDPPGEREFILDKAQLLDEGTENELRATCDQLLSDKAIPIIVVTINKMSDHIDGNLRIETFARLLFDQWGIGHEQVTTKKGEKPISWNNGILLLVSKGDRKARIELGDDWRRDKDALCKQIMDQQIVPAFKQGDFGGGIAAGVKGLDAMAREKKLPAPPPRPGSWMGSVLMIVLVVGGIIAIISLARNGSSGWAWIIGAAVFGIVGYMLYNMATNSGSGDSGGSFGGGSFGGGSFGGGSFGGGFSGGGGATGSW